MINKIFSFKNKNPGCFIPGFYFCSIFLVVYIFIGYFLLNFIFITFRRDINLGVVILNKYVYEIIKIKIKSNNIKLNLNQIR